VPLSERLISEASNDKRKSLNCVVHLDLAGCKLITDSGIVGIANHLPALELLNLNGLDKLTSSCLKSLSHQCPRLRRLMLNFTPEIKETDLMEVKARAPKLVIVRFIVESQKTTDDGLRMPFPPTEKKKKVKPKKKV